MTGIHQRTAPTKISRTDWNDLITYLFGDSDDAVLSAAKFTTGTFDLARIPTMDDAHIPNVDTLSYGAAFADAQIPNLAATKITSGTFDLVRIPTMDDAHIPNVDTLSYGAAFALVQIPTMDDAHIPNVDTLSYGAAFAVAQIPSHKTSHQDGGTDEINIAGLDGHRFIFYGTCTTNLSAIDTTLEYLGIPFAIAVQTTEADYIHMVVQRACTIKNFRVDLVTAPGAGKSRTFTVRKNETSDLSVTVTISEAATSGTDYVNSDALVAGDYITLKALTTGTATASRAMWSLELTEP